MELDRLLGALDQVLIAAPVVLDHAAIGGIGVGIIRHSSFSRVVNGQGSAAPRA